VPHAIGMLSGSAPSFVAIVDAGGTPPAPYPLTPVSHEVPWSSTSAARTLPLSWPAYVQLGATLPGATRTPEVNAWANDQIQARAGVLGPLDFTTAIPAGLNPYPWQVEAAARFARVGQAMLSDDPGTGKTISAILSVLERQTWGPGDALPCVVVCPASVRAAWVKAWRAWAPEVNVSLYAGSKRAEQLDGDPRGVLVMSYEVMSRDADKLARYLSREHDGRGTLVLDEHHLIKSQDSARSKAARRLAPHAACHIVLSGTPITHHPGDLWPALNALEPLAWPARSRYVDRYCDQVTEDYGTPKIVGLVPERKAEFELALLGVQRRVSKADALSLPPKVYSVREVEIPTAWRKVYDGMRDRMLAELPDEPDPMFAMSTLVQLARLQQLAAAPADVWSVIENDKDGNPVEKQKVKLKGPSWKVDALLEILAERPDQQVLVFSPSRQVIRLAEDALGAAGETFSVLVGDQGQRARESQIQAFQDGQRRVMLATTQAGGVGVTLTAASTVVFLGRPFSIVDAMQAEDRAHRIGSERHESIEIIDVLTAGTVDQSIRGVLRGKAGALAEVLRDPRVAAEILGGIAS
jgi:SNF2 family DNA or RNA helicase